MSINSINKATYTSNEGVSSYINTTLQSPEISIFIKYRDNYQNKNILDIGCGAGRTSFYLRNFSDQYIGIDYSASMIDFCKKEFPTLKFQHADARDLSEYRDSTFDFIIFSYNGIDYVSNEDRITILSEIYRVLKKDGLFVFSTHNRNFNNIESKPQFQLSLNPINFMRNLINFTKQKSNNNKLRKEQLFTNEYAILNDSGNNFSLLTYHITKTKQIEQLNNNGFTLLEMYDTKGQTLHIGADDSSDPWIYYVTKKT